jgi:hypothetical protein
VGIGYLSDTVADQLIINVTDDKTSSNNDKPLLSSTDADIKRTAPLSDSS